MLEDHKVELSGAQIRKLISGGAINVSPKMHGGQHTLAFMPQNSRKMKSAMRKNKGVRITLHPDEDVMDGGRVSLKGIGKRMKKARVGKVLGKAGVDILTKGIMPGLGGVAGELLGGPLGGVAGATAAGYLGDKLDNYAEKKGYGMEEEVGGKLTLRKIGKAAKKTGKVIAKAAKSKAGKAVMSTAVKLGSEVAGAAISEYTGNPAAGVALEKAISKGGEKAIETGSLSKGLMKGATASSGMLEDMAVEYVDDYIDKKYKNKGQENEVMEEALIRQFPEQTTLINDSQDIVSGSGIRRARGGVRRTRRGIRKMVGSGTGAYSSPMYLQARRSLVTGQGFQTASGRMIKQDPDNEDAIQLGSPFQRINSPAMSPFVGNSPQLMGLVTRRGGSMFPAGGRKGMGMYPAGGMSGGSFVPSG
tara:strand:+ start:125 stop:1378 length:1254 start_codon:yes stop_codon:yes gene_type:complete